MSVAKTAEQRARRNAAYRARYAKNPGIATRRKKLPAPTRVCPERCELCNKVQQRRLNLDHDHATNKFRGWLCGNCNRGLGFFQDSPDLLERAATYLKVQAN